MKKNQRYILEPAPEGFQYKPACGMVNGDGSVTISGCNMKQEDIDTYGASYKELDDIFREIDEEMETKKSE